MCAAQGVCFTVLNRTKQGLGLNCAKMRLRVVSGILKVFNNFQRAAQGVCFTVLHRTKGGLGVDCVRGNGFVVARKPLKLPPARKTFMHWASADTFRPGQSLLDAGLPRKGLAEEREERLEWTAPCYFDISIMGCGDSFGEALILIFLGVQAVTCSASCSLSCM